MTRDEIDRRAGESEGAFGPLIRAVFGAAGKDGQGAGRAATLTAGRGRGEGVEGSPLAGILRSKM